MKTPLSRLKAAFTLTELMVATAVAVIVGYTGFTILHVGLMLFAKNSAINVSHQQARIALLRIENDFHASASQVQLTNASGTLLPASTGPEAGISFQIMRGGPYLLTADASKGDTSLRVNFGTDKPLVKERMLIPLHGVEADIVSVSGSGPEYTIQLSAPLKRDMKVSLANGGGTATQGNVQCFLTERVYYVVSNGRLTRRQATDLTPSLLASGIVSPTPFRLAPGANGVFDRKIITGIDLATVDTGTSNLGFRSANILTNATVPVRHRLAENL